MTSTLPRTSLGSLAGAAFLSLALTTGALAQVATLASPDETPEPGAVAEVLEFEDQSEALLAFAQCMRDNGVDMDDPQAGSGPGLRGFFGGGPDGPEDGIDRLSEAFLDAQQACSMYLEASRPELDPAAQQELLEQQLVLARCLRDQGFEEYPDPVIDSAGRLERLRGQGAAELGIDRRSPAFQEAMSVCRDELGVDGGPGFGPGGGFAAGSGGS